MRKISAMIIAAALLTAVALLVGCGGKAATEYYANYYTEQLDTYPNTLLTYDTGLKQWSFSDDVFDVTVELEEGKDYAFSIVLKNTTDGALVIDWNRVFYIDIHGRAHHAIHNGVNYLDPVASQTPTVVPPGGVLTDLIQPADLAQEDGAVRFTALRTNDTDIWGDWPENAVILMPVHSVEGEKVYRFQLDMSNYPAY